jgi:fanconi anemia group D2 protein
LVDCSLTFCLDKELDEIIAVNLCPKVIGEMKKLDNAIVMGLQSCHSNALTSMFRLVRGLEREDLTEIDALLGCPLVMPTSKTIDEFEMLSPEQQSVVIHTLFHAVNWFHEVINCFSYLIKHKNGDKVN